MMGSLLTANEKPMRYGLINAKLYKRSRFEGNSSLRSVIIWAILEALNFSHYIYNLQWSAWWFFFLAILWEKQIRDPSVYTGMLIIFQLLWTLIPNSLCVGSLRATCQR